MFEKFDEKCYMWRFDGKNMAFENGDVIRKNAFALLIVKQSDGTVSISGNFGLVCNEGKPFVAGYKDPGKHGWELRIQMEDIDVRVDAQNLLPDGSPEFLFINGSNAGTELFAVCHGEGYGDVHRLRFPASTGWQWLSIFKLYLTHWGCDIEDIWPLSEKK